MKEKSTITKGRNFFFPIVFKCLLMLYFINVTAMATDNPDLKYQLKVNNGEVFNFTNTSVESWSVKGSQGGELSFHQAKNISGVEVNGFMILTLPANRTKLNDPLDIKVSLLPTQKNSWIIIFKKAIQSGTTLNNVPILVKNGSVVNQQVKISQVQFRNPCRVTFTSGGKELLTSQTKIGFNQFFVPVPMVKSD